MPFPTPRLAPVTRATFPFNLCIKIFPPTILTGIRRHLQIVFIDAELSFVLTTWPELQRYGWDQRFDAPGDSRRWRRSTRFSQRLGRQAVGFASDVGSLMYAASGK